MRWILRISHSKIYCYLLHLFWSQCDLFVGVSIPYPCFKFHNTCVSLFFSLIWLPFSLFFITTTSSVPNLIYISSFAICLFIFDEFFIPHIFILIFELKISKLSILLPHLIEICLWMSLILVWLFISYIQH